MLNSVIVSFIADDRPGLVELVSSVIARHDGSWQDGRLSQLGGKFAGLLLVSLPGAALPAFETDLAALTAEGIDCTVTAAGAVPSSSGRIVTIELIGPDRAGIVLEVTRALKQAGINLLRMESRVSSAPMSGESLFQAKLEATAPEGYSTDALAAQLERIADAMALDIDISQGSD